MDDLFTISIAESAEARVCCRGELDICAVPDLKAALERALHRRDGGVLVEMAEVRYIDSACISTLLRAHDQLLARGERLTLVSASPAVRRALHLLSLDQSLGLAPEMARELTLATCHA